MIGANLTRMDSVTRRLLTNPEVLEVDQHGSDARAAYRDGNIVVWLAVPSSQAGKYLAAFNLGEAPLSQDIPWPALGIDAAVSSMRDLWLRKGAAAPRLLRIRLAAHASALYRISVVGPRPR
jgi:hypothetical protein